MATQVGSIPGNGHQVSGARGDVTITAGTDIELGRAIGLNSFHVHGSVETIPDTHRTRPGHGQPRKAQATRAPAAAMAAMTKAMSAFRGTNFRYGSNPTPVIIVPGVTTTPDHRPFPYESISVERRAGIVTIVFNRPERKNAVNGKMWIELLDILTEVQHNSADRVVVLTGAGGEFCSGADLTAMGDGGGRSHSHSYYSMREVTGVIMALARLPQPTIAKVRGVAVGVGCNLAFGCDLVVASETARFSQIFSKRGLSLDGGGSWLLPRRVGLHRAKELAFFADIIDAAEAERLGLINRLLPDDQVDAFVEQWAQRLLALPPIALAQSKRLLNNAMNVTLEEALDDEGAAQTVNFGTKDTPEAIAAWLEKRDPIFKGR